MPPLVSSFFSYCSVLATQQGGFCFFFLLHFQSASSSSRPPLTDLSTQHKGRLSVPQHKELPLDAAETSAWLLRCCFRGCVARKLLDSVTCCSHLKVCTWTWRSFCFCFFPIQTCSVSVVAFITCVLPTSLPVALPCVVLKLATLSAAQVG